MRGYPYPFTLEEGKEPVTEADALAGHYGKKKVSYKLVDDTLSLEGTSLNDKDYDILGIQWSARMRTATYNEDKKSFTETAIPDYKEEDKVTIEVRTDANVETAAWKTAAVYSMMTGSYDSTESTLVTDSSGGNLTFAAGVKGVRLSCKNAYYYTTLNMDHRRQDEGRAEQSGRKYDAAGRENHLSENTEWLRLHPESDTDLRDAKGCHADKK